MTFFDRLTRTTIVVRVFLEANWGSYGYIYLWLPGVEGACKTMAASHNVNAAKAFVARFEGAEKTVAASRNVSALLNFRTHPCMERACPFRLL